MHGIDTINYINRQRAAEKALVLAPVESFDTIADRTIAARLAAADATPANLRPTPLRDGESHFGVTKGHDEEQGGLRGHSIDRETYPFTVSARIIDGAVGWYVWHALTGAEADEYTGPDACDKAHAHARQLKRDAG